MIRKGRIVVAMDPDIHDMYICEVLRGGEEYRENLLVRILEMVRYPVQHAVMHPEIASENPPLPPGSTAMLKFVNHVEGRAPGAEEGSTVSLEEWYRAVGTRGYKATFDRALAAYEKTVHAALAFREKYPMSSLSIQDPAELEILARHKKRQFQGRRSSQWS